MQDCLTCHKILQHGASAFTSCPKGGGQRTFIAIKNPAPFPGLNPCPWVQDQVNLGSLGAGGSFLYQKQINSASVPSDTALVLAHSNIFGVSTDISYCIGLGAVTRHSHVLLCLPIHYTFPGIIASTYPVQVTLMRSEVFTAGKCGLWSSGL
jgi:hypothetical protein